MMTIVRIVNVTSTIYHKLVLRPVANASWVQKLKQFSGTSQPFLFLLKYQTPFLTNPSFDSIIRVLLIKRLTIMLKKG